MVNSTSLSITTADFLVAVCVVILLYAIIITIIIKIRQCREPYWREMPLNRRCAYFFGCKEVDEFTGNNEHRNSRIIRRQFQRCLDDVVNMEPPPYPENEEITPSPPEYEEFESPPPYIERENIFTITVN